MAAYCALSDVTAFLPSGGLPDPARAAYGHATTDTIESDGHGLVDGQAVTFRAGAGGSLPAPLVADTTYYAKVVSPSTYQLAATAGGAAIDLTTDGVNFVAMSELPWAEWMEWGSRQVDTFLPAHVVPLIPDATTYPPPAQPYPQIVVTASAELAALLGLSKTAGSSIDLGARIDAVGQRIARWAKTLPVRGVAKSTQSPVNLAITSTAGAVDPRGWATNGNDVIP